MLPKLEILVHNESTVVNKLVARHHNKACVPFGAMERYVVPEFFRQKRIIKSENWATKTEEE
jgi:hypothetical protein